MNASASLFSFIVMLLCICAGCASIVPPSGGPKDVTPPKLVSVTPHDSLLNTRVGKIRLLFDEYVTVSDATKEVEISPILAIAPTVIGVNKHVTVHIADTLLEDNTTYRISFGRAIKDLHEGNAFSHYTYTFSTGSYFDSLQISGTVVNAATGLPDSSIYILLYSSSKSDSAVVREKPKYVIKADNNGSFTMKGLPARKFHLYALKDANENLIYDGAGEMIGFYDKIIIPGDSTNGLVLKVFPEVIDSSLQKKTDTTAAQNGLKNVTLGGNKSGSKKDKEKQNIAYSVNVDTSNTTHRTHDVKLPIDIAFNKIPVIAPGKITLTFDSDGIAVPAAFIDSMDTVNKTLLHIMSKYGYWKENTVYTLRLPKGFAKDTGGTDAMPSRYTYRTFRDEDYGILHVHMPTKYFGRQYLLMIMADKDTIYQKQVTDTLITLTLLKPAVYTFRVINDKNENGKWDTGDLFKKQQPEDVIPYTGSVKLKAGWENTVDDFGPAPPAPKKGAQNDSPPPK